MGKAFLRAAASLGPLSYDRDGINEPRFHLVPIEHDIDSQTAYRSTTRQEIKYAASPPGDAGLARRQNEHLAGALPQQMLAKSPVLIGQLRTLGDQWR